VVIDILPPDNIACHFERFGNKMVKARTLLTSYKEIKNHL
jgi:hypothetical protein